MSLSSRRSRRVTPWDRGVQRTPLQDFLRDHYQGIYHDKHTPLSESDEACVINSFEPESCPLCESDHFVRAGLTRNRVQRYKCLDCGMYFTPLTGSIFQDHKISISEWIEYTLNVVRYLSINADSWNNRNAFTTSRYWFQKLMIVLEETKNGIYLRQKNVMDETYYSVSSDEMQRNEDGRRLPGISRIQICIEVACSASTTYCALHGLGKPTGQAVYQALKDHVEPGAVLVHDMEKSHNLLVKGLGLVSQAYNSLNFATWYEAHGVTMSVDNLESAHQRRTQTAPP